MTRSPFARARQRMTNAYCEARYVTAFYKRLDSLLSGHVAFRTVLAHWNAEARRHARGSLGVDGWPAARIRPIRITERRPG